MPPVTSRCLRSNSTKTQTAVNNLPSGISPDDMNTWCEEWTTSSDVPYVPLVHGFCFGITREALNQLGGFDEELFPEGYGEENDYCLRALSCSLWPVVATHTFVFHAKTKSYTSERRHLLSERAQEALYRRHGRERFLEYVELLQRNPILGALRQKSANLFRQHKDTEAGGARAPLTQLLGNLSDDGWLTMLRKSVDNPIVDGIQLPSFPPEALQIGSVGSSGKSAVEEAFRFYRFVRDRLVQYGRPLKPTSRVLDFGIGWGRIMRCFLRDVGVEGLYGVDVSDRFLMAARSSQMPGELSKISPTGSLPHPDNHFDLVYAYSVFTHLPEDVQDIWLPEIRRVLKPGGLFIATVEPPRFLDFVRRIDEEKKVKSQWFRELSASLALLPDAQERLEETGFIFLATNNGKTYGDTVITLKYVERHWAEYFEVLDYLDDPALFWQSVVTTRKREPSSTSAGGYRFSRL